MGSKEVDEDASMKLEDIRQEAEERNKARQGIVKRSKTEV